MHTFYCLLSTQPVPVILLLAAYTTSTCACNKKTLLYAYLSACVHDFLFVVYFVEFLDVLCSELQQNTRNLSVELRNVLFDVGDGFFSGSSHR